MAPPAVIEPVVVVCEFDSMTVVSRLAVVDIYVKVYGLFETVVT